MGRSGRSGKPGALRDAQEGPAAGPAGGLRELRCSGQMGRASRRPAAGRDAGPRGTATRRLPAQQRPWLRKHSSPARRKGGPCQRPTSALCPLLSPRLLWLSGENADYRAEAGPGERAFPPPCCSVRSLLFPDPAPSTTPTFNLGLAGSAVVPGASLASTPPTHATHSSRPCPLT